MTVKVRNIHDYLGSTDMFRVKGWKLVETIEEADIVCLNGGEDIATEIYGQRPAQSGVPEFRSKRDKYEELMVKNAMAQGKFIFGICRGAQLVNCLNGGKLWQHISNHNNGSHWMYDKFTQENIFTTSCHHQEMIPGEDAQVIAVAAQANVKIGPGGALNLEAWRDRKEDGKDIEVLWYPKTRSLCVQGHPEWAAPGSIYVEYCFSLIESLRVDSVWPPKTVTSLVAV